MGDAASSISSSMGLGAKLDDSFVKTQTKLGTGSFGTVWRGLDKASGQTVAIKEISKLGPGAKCGNYQKEVQMMASIKHQNIVGLVATFDADTCFQIVLEYCDGGDLTDKITELGKKLSTAMAANFSHQIVLAVRALHSNNIVHLDIKPDNFLIANVDSREGRLEVLKLADFGLATYLSRPDEKLFFKCGTPAFMAPEVHDVRDTEKGYSKPADIWSVGIVLFMMLHGGVHPFMNGSKLDRVKLAEGKSPKSPACRISMMFKESLAESGKELTRLMLLSEAHLRPTAEEALAHAFLET